MIRINMPMLLGKKRAKQIDLANATGIRKATISDLYNECSNSITFEQLDKICQYLDCDVGDLLERVPNK